MKKVEALFRYHFKDTESYTAPGELGDQFDAIANTIEREIAPLLSDEGKKTDYLSIIVGGMNQIEALAFCRGFKYASELLLDK